MRWSADELAVLYTLHAGVLYTLTSSLFSIHCQCVFIRFFPSLTLHTLNFKIF